MSRPGTPDDPLPIGPCRRTGVGMRLDHSRGAGILCSRCANEVDDASRFCPWYAAPQRTKIVEQFRAHPLLERPPGGLRVSRYLRGTRHVRLSIWGPDRATAALALDEREARRLAASLTETGHLQKPASRLERAKLRVEEFASRRGG